MTKENLIIAIGSAISIAEVLKKLNMSVSTANYRSFHKCVKKYKLNIDHFLGQSHLKNKINNIKTTIPLDSILIENSSYAGIAQLKQRLLKSNLLIYECYNCSISSWDNKPLSLQLDHINGVHNDHRIENLRLLCPNCHSQTLTFCGRNKKKSEKLKCICGNNKRSESISCKKCAAKKREKIIWPVVNELLALTKSIGYSETARKLGVSISSIKDRIRLRHHDI